MHLKNSIYGTDKRNIHQRQKAERHKKATKIVWVEISVNTQTRFMHFDVVKKRHKNHVKLFLLLSLSLTAREKIFHS